MSAVNEKARDIAAKATGLRPDQIERAVAEYRQAAEALHNEPQWRAIMHMSGDKEAHAQYGAPETMVVLEIFSWKSHNEWHEERHYGLHGKAYDTYGEARSAELIALTKTKPHTVNPAPSTPEPMS